MTCRHGAFDPDCSRYNSNISQLKADYEREIQKKYAALSPDINNFQIEDIEQVGNYLVVKAKYPNCAKCEYEGTKIMVFADCTIKDAIKWREVDPHFRGKAPTAKTAAPSPVVRFPGSAEGWKDALTWAAMKQSSQVKAK